MAVAPWAVLGVMSLGAPVAAWLTPRVRYRPFPWDNQQREDGGQE
jgi:hypothetical protein